MPTTLRLTRLMLAVSLLALLGTCAVATAQAAMPSLHVTNAFGFGHPSRLTGYAAGVSGNSPATRTNHESGRCLPGSS